MNDVTQGTSKGIIVAAVVGAAVGAGVALLLAPCSGRETRRWLAHKTREVKDRTTSAFEQGRDAFRRAAKEIGRDAEGTAQAHDRPANTEVVAKPVRG